MAVAKFAVWLTFDKDTVRLEHNKVGYYKVKRSELPPYAGTSLPEQHSYYDSGPIKLKYGDKLFQSVWVSCVCVATPTAELWTKIVQYDIKLSLQELLAMKEIVYYRGARFEISVRLVSELYSLFYYATIRVNIL